MSELPATTVEEFEALEDGTYLIKVDLYAVHEHAGDCLSRRAAAFLGHTKREGETPTARSESVDSRGSGCLK